MALVMLWGTAGDAPFDAVRAQFERCGAAHFTLEQSRAAQASLEAGGRLRMGERELDLDEIGAVYVRSFESWRVLQRAGFAPQSEEVRRAALLDASLYGWLAAADALIVNPLVAMGSNTSKPYQAELIRAGGFEIPPTLITTDPQAAREFVAAHADVVYKSVSGERSIVARLPAGSDERLEDVVWCPTQFQAYVPGVDWRVHVVGDELFACQIRSDAVDYRYAAQSGPAAQLVAAALPADVEHRCRALAGALGLHFAGIDLRLTPQGDWYCFEVNPSPGFTYFEQTGQPIGEALVRLLRAGATRQ